MPGTCCSRAHARRLDPIGSPTRLRLTIGAGTHRRLQLDRSPTRRGCEVTRMTEEATLTLTPSIFRDPIHRVKWVARIAPTAIMPSNSLRVRASRTPRFTRAKGTRIREARARRYRAIVMNGDVDQEMKMAENETDTTARAIAA